MTNAEAIAALKALSCELEDGPCADEDPPEWQEAIAHAIDALEAAPTPAPQPEARPGPPTLPGDWAWIADECAKHPSGAYIRQYADGRWAWFRSDGEHSARPTRRDTAVQAAAAALGIEITQTDHFKFGWRIGTKYAPYPHSSADAAALDALEHAHTRKESERG